MPSCLASTVLENAGSGSLRNGAIVQHQWMLMLMCTIAPFRKLVVLLMLLHLLLLQDSLSGDSKTLMLVNVNPTEADAGESACSLGFAARVRGVELGPAKKQIEAGAEIQELRSQLQAMQQQV